MTKTRKLYIYLILKANMTEDSRQHISLALYQYLCEHIVGSEETIKTKRLFITVTDILGDDKANSRITSGSFGEGLEMKGSDFDYMYVMKDFQVYENKSDIEFDIYKTYFEIKTDDAKLGFVKLKLLHCIYKDFVNLCLQENGVLYLSNSRFKSYFGYLNFPNKAEAREVIHGPCLSDRDGLTDHAFCVHMKSWITQADQWITRSRASWPSKEIVSTITEHGVLFVPIGVKGSPNEEIEWRISFSAGEKFLIYSFHHTQLLCYALLKIVLKDIISKDTQCKDLLCSYYLKNIIFWVSEEMPLSEWKPHNLIHCFMQCFERLIYCVEYSVCPHYFIPQNNMFENKIEGENRRVLLDKLNTLHRFSWQCILLSPQLQTFFNFRYLSKERTSSFSDHFECIASSAVLCLHRNHGNVFERVVNKILRNSSPTIQLYYYFCLSSVCQNQAQQVQIHTNDRNKGVYREFKKCRSYLLQGVCHDPVSGWFLLASLLYKMNEYKLALAILKYALSKCSQEKIYRDSKLSSLQRNLLNSKMYQNKGTIRVVQLLCLDKIYFDMHSKIIPLELEQEVLRHEYFMPPVVHAHFLSFLCHYHLRDVRELRNSLASLQLTLSEDYFIHLNLEKSTAYNVLRVALQMTGETDSAREAFQQAILLEPKGIFSRARERLSNMTAIDHNRV